MDFVIDNKDFESIKAQVPRSKIVFEIRKIDSKYYSVFQHDLCGVYECGTFTKDELKTIWKMLTE